MEKRKTTTKAQDEHCYNISNRKYTKMTETDFKPLPKKLVELTQYYADKIYRLSGYDPLTESKGKYITRRRVILACKLLEQGYKKTTVERAIGINRSRIGLY